MTSHCTFEAPRSRSRSGARCWQSRRGASPRTAISPIESGRRAQRARRQRHRVQSRRVDHPVPPRHPRIGRAGRVPLGAGPQARDAESGGRWSCTGTSGGRLCRLAQHRRRPFACRYTALGRDDGGGESPALLTLRGSSRLRPPRRRARTSRLPSGTGGAKHGTLALGIHLAGQWRERVDGGAEHWSAWRMTLRWQRSPLRASGGPPQGLTIRTSLELYCRQRSKAVMPFGVLLVSPFFAEMACKRSPFLFRGKYQCRSVP